MISFNYFTDGAFPQIKTLQNYKVVLSQVLTQRFDSPSSARSHSLHKRFNEAVAGKTAYITNCVTNLIFASEKLGHSSHLGNKSLNHLPCTHTHTYIIIYIKIYVCAHLTLTWITPKALQKCHASWNLPPKLLFLNESCPPSMNDAFQPLQKCKDILFSLWGIFQLNTALTTHLLCCFSTWVRAGVTRTRGREHGGKVLLWTDCFPLLHWIWERSGMSVSFGG